MVNNFVFLCALILVKKKKRFFIIICPQSWQLYTSHYVYSTESVIIFFYIVVLFTCRAKNFFLCRIIYAHQLNRVWHKNHNILSNGRNENANNTSLTLFFHFAVPYTRWTQLIWIYIYSLWNRDINFIAETGVLRLVPSAIYIKKAASNQIYWEWPTFRFLIQSTYCFSSELIVLFCKNAS